jgi:hypothetical protein
MLENLVTPAPKIVAPEGWSPSVVFDGDGGEATLPAVPDGESADIDAFLREAGIDPAQIEIIEPSKISRWQVARPFPLEPAWHTAVKVRWRSKKSSINLPLLYSLAKKTKPPITKTVAPGKALIVLWSDLQVGKVDHRGGIETMLARVAETQSKLIKLVKQTKPERIIFSDVGDVLEGFTSKMDTQQSYSNDLSIMQQVDLATSLAWESLKQLVKYAPVTYLSVGSNHCQFRINKQQVGSATDDWGIHIGRTLARLSKEVGLDITFHEPAKHDESLALDVFGDGYHVLGMVHGHQANRPEGIPDWWRKQSFGKQSVTAATVLVSGHFHHLRVQELGSTSRGTSRFWVQAATLDNGSNWWRLNSGEDSQPGLVCFVLERDTDFTGTVHKL